VTASSSSTATSTAVGADARTPRSGLRARWRVIDIVVASVLGVASGLVFVIWNTASVPIGGFFEPLLPGLQALAGGGWLFAGVLTGIVIRKPGAALYGELLAAFVSMLVGNVWGVATLLSGLTQGLGAELVLLVFLYANWRAYVAVLAGMGAGLAMAITDLIYSYPASTPLFATIYTASAPRPCVRPESSVATPQTLPTSIETNAASSSP
jgi:energy-coupling factor transport system substrate-specific component